MTKNTDYGRRNFLNVASLLFGDLVLNNGKVTKSLLEGTAEAAEVKTTREIRKSPDSIEHIVNPLYDAIEATRWGRGSDGYRSVYDKYGEVIQNIKEAYKNLSWDNPDVLMKRKGLEINARMWRAYLLSHQAGNNIVTNETIKVKNFPVIHASRALNHADKLYNLSKALEDYEAVEGIWEEALKHGKEFPYSLNIPKLGERGNTARLDTVYKRMTQVIEELERVAPQYRQILQEKKSEIADKLKYYNLIN